MRSFPRVGFWLGFLICGVAAAGAQPPPAPMTVNIEAQPLGAALNAWAEQTGYMILMPVAGGADSTMASRVTGQHTPEEALRLLLVDSGLKYSFVGERTVSVRPANEQEDTSVLKTSAARGTGLGDVRVAQVEDQDSSNNAAAMHEGSDSNIEEIIVTATKRSESVQDVPLSISVISNRDIERRGLVGQSDYLRSMPGVSQIEAGAGNTSVNMRGVSADPQNFDRGAKATVGYYLNDIPLTGYALRGGADVKLVDLQRVEVIRGPQGTLYGSGSLGGTVRNIPNPPQLDRLGGNLSAGYSDTAKAGSDGESVEAALNVPLVEGKLAARAVGYWFENSGYVDNIAGSDPATLARAATYGVAELAQNEQGVGGDEYVGGRISFLFQPIDALKANLTYLKQDITQHGLPDAEPSRPGRYQQARLQLSDIVGGGSERLEDNLEIYNAALEYGFDWGSWVSSTSLVHETYLEKREIGVFFGGAPPVPQRNLAQTEAFAQELRFASQFTGPLQVLAGLYYEDAQRDLTSQNYFGGRTGLENTAFTQVVITDDFTEGSIRQKAVFGEVSYELSKLKLTVGGRGFEYDDSTRTTRRPSSSVPAGAITRLIGDNSGSTFKANLAYKPSDQALWYAQWSQGFRLGSPVAAALSTCDNDNDGIIDGTNISSGPRTLDPDTMDSYELGTKLAFMGGDLVVDAAVYRNEWQGVPIRVIIPCGVGAIDNAGEATTQGVELSSGYSLTRQLRLNLGASYTDAELTQNAPAIGGVAGDRLPGSAKYTVYVAPEYEFDILGKDSYVRADYTYVGSFYNNLKQRGVNAGDYGLLNLRTGMNFGRVGVDLFVKNLTDADEPTWIDATFTGANARFYRLRPRTIGLAARYTF